MGASLLANAICQSKRRVTDHYTASEQDLSHRGCADTVDIKPTTEIAPLGRPFVGNKSKFSTGALRNFPQPKVIHANTLIEGVPHDYNIKLGERIRDVTLHDECGSVASPLIRCR